MFGFQGDAAVVLGPGAVDSAADDFVGRSAVNSDSVPEEVATCVVAAS